MSSIRSAAIEVELYDTATDGRGVGRLPEGKVVFVEGGIGGERVDVRVRSEGRNLAEGYAERVRKSSNLRQLPPCPQAGECGGCQLQHITLEGQLTLKRQWLLQTLRRVGRWNPEQIDLAQRLLRSHQASSTGYRVRARWHFDGTRLGFFARRSHQVVSAEGCLLLAPTLAVARGELLKRLSSDELHGMYRSAGLVGLQIEATLLRDGGVDLRLCGLVCQGEGTSQRQLRRRLGLLMREWNGRPPGRFLEVSHPLLEPFFIGARGFLQPHQEALSLYRAEVLESLQRLLRTEPFGDLWRRPEWIAWDLYCGAGALSDIPALVAGGETQVKTWMVDREESSIAALCRNHPDLASHARVEDVGHFIRGRLDHGELPDLLVCDPPREGVGIATATMLSEALSRAENPIALVWLACDNASLARDLKPFLESGFRLHSMASFDCFSYTTHAETVVLLWGPADL